MLKELLSNEKKYGIAYFFILLTVLLSIWGILIVKAFNIQQESAEAHYTSPASTSQPQN